MGSDRLRMLRLGRGEGFRAALRAGPSASEDILACVLADPRWDRQLETRDPYYAQLMLTSGTSVEPVRNFILNGEMGRKDSDTWLPVGVLATLAARGHQPAAEAIASCVASAADWALCFDSLEAAGGPELLRQVISEEDIRTLMAQVPVEQLADAVQYVDAPWDAWAKNIPELRFLLGERPEDPTRSVGGPLSVIAHHLRVPAVPDDLSAQSTQELLANPAPGTLRERAAILASRRDPETKRLIAAAADTGDDWSRALALRVLTLQGSTAYILAATEYLKMRAETQARGVGVQREYIRYLVAQAPSVTLPLARAWLMEPHPLSLAGQSILAKHADRSDYDLLLREGSLALERGDMFRLCSIVEALTTAGPDPALPFLTEVYASAPYAWCRRQVVTAMSACQNSAADSYLVEALWDCEDEAREIACAYHARSGCVAPGAQTAAARVWELAGDEHELDGVRKAARAALNQL